MGKKQTQKKTTCWTGADVLGGCCFEVRHLFLGELGPSSCHTPLTKTMQPFRSTPLTDHRTPCSEIISSITAGQETSKDGELLPDAGGGFGHYYRDALPSDRLLPLFLRFFLTRYTWKVLFWNVLVNRAAYACASDLMASQNRGWVAETRSGSLSPSPSMI